MKSFKNFFTTTNITLVVFAILAASFFYVYAVDFVHDPHKQAYMLDFAASCLAIVPTVVVVNYLADLRWESARTTSNDELRTLIDQHLRAMVLPWGYMSGAGHVDQMTRALTDSHRKQYFAVVASKLIENSGGLAIHGFGPGE